MTRFALKQIKREAVTCILYDHSDRFAVLPVRPQMQASVAGIGAGCKTELVQCAL